MTPKTRKSEINDGKYYAQITIEKGFKTKAAAERWAQALDTRFTAEAEVDSISTSIWEPAT